MPKIKTIMGDIVDEAEFGEYDVVLHNCNCQRRQGAGVARDIANAWPEVEAADAATPLTRDKLGTYSMATVTRGDVTFDVYNVYGQYFWGRRGLQHFSPDMFDRAMEKLAEELKDKAPLNILFPAIGSGAGGGQWSTVSEILTHHLGDHNLTLISLPRRSKGATS